jgi:hypothetical protein
MTRPPDPKEMAITPPPVPMKRTGGGWTQKCTSQALTGKHVMIVGDVGKSRNVAASLRELGVGVSYPTRFHPDNYAGVKQEELAQLLGEVRRDQPDIVIVYRPGVKPPNPMGSWALKLGERLHEQNIPTLILDERPSGIFSAYQKELREKNIRYVSFRETEPGALPALLEAALKGRRQEPSR